MGIYLDNAATTKVKPEVIEAMMHYFTDKWYNPSSLYSPATKIKKDIENSRKIVGNYINAKSDEIFFTSSGSESNCWAIQGFVNYWRRKGRNVSIITSTIEHKSILNCVDNMNVNVHYVGVDNEGFINMKSLESLIHDANMEAHETLVSIQYANNEIGTIQHIKKIAEIVHKYDAVLHSDVVQAFGQIPIDVKELGIDMLSASGHKIGTPKGIGILYKKDSVHIDPLIYGTQMDSMRGGTENVAYIVGMAKAVELLQNDNDRKLRLTILRNNFISQLKALGCTVNGSLYERLPNNISVTFFQDINAENMVYLLDMCEIYIGTGSACQSHSTEVSYVLKAIGMSEEDAMKTIRITLPDDITMDEIDKAVCNITKQIMLLTTEDQ